MTYGIANGEFFGSRYFVAGTKFCPRNRTFSRKWGYLTRKTVAVTVPDNISPSVCLPLK